MNKFLIFSSVGLCALGFSCVVNATTYTAGGSMQSCASMGYKSTRAQCDGFSRIRCPWNENAYFCGRNDNSNISGDNVNCTERNGKTNAQWCNMLGYKYTESQCGSYVALPCPFSSSNYFCSGKENCSADGYSYSSESACKQACRACTSCPGDTNKYKGTDCPTNVTCAAGTVLYSNNKCYSTGANVTLADGSKPVGVMISNTLAIDLMEADAPSANLYTWGAGAVVHGTGNPFPLWNQTFYNVFSGGTFATSATTSSNVGKAHSCTRNYCSHLSAYPGQWFLPSTQDIVVLKNNLSAYISGMSLAGHASSVTSINDAKISKIGYRALSVTEGCSCPHPDTSTSCQPYCPTVWGAGSVSWGGGNYKRCMRLVNQLASVPTCASGGTYTFSNKYCQGDHLCETVGGDIEHENEAIDPSFEP